MPRWDAKSDGNQQAIMDALRAVGCSCVSLHRVGQGVPDLLVGIFGHNYLLEIKQDHRDLTAAEMEFFVSWRGQKTVVRTPEQAIEYILEDMEQEG